MRLSWRRTGCWLFGALILISLPHFVFIKAAVAQVEPPNKQFLFFEDRLDKKKKKKKKIEIQKKQSDAMRKAREAGFPYDITATNIDYDSTGKKIKGSGGVIIGYASSIVEAEEGEVSLEDKVANLRGDVRVTDTGGTVAAEEMSFKLDDGTGIMKNSELFFEDGHYHFLGEEIAKVGKDDFEIKECTLTTCECAESDSTDPWRLEGKTGTITKEGYGQIYDGLLYAYGVPVLYTPYALFPVKTERQSGFLPGTFGGAGRSGFSFALPLFLVLDRSTDATISGVYNSNARVGVDTEFRKAFSDYTDLEMGGLYFNESMRGDSLLGTNLKDLYGNPQTLRDVVDLNRYGGYLNFDSVNNQLFDNDLQFIVRGKYVSDDLLLREYNDKEIGPYNTRFVTSRATARYNFLDSFSLETAAEYNQAMVDNDKTTFQRIPDVSLGGLHIFRPFGENPLGAKLVLTDSVTETTFVRDQLFDGSRAEIYEQLNLPFHYKNYFDVTLGTDIRATKYSLMETETGAQKTVVNPATGQQETIIEHLPDSSDRVLPGFTADMGTTLEQVFDVNDINPIKYIAELGQQGRSGELKRIKHTFEPNVRYRFVPEVDQDDNPAFDSTDRLPQRNLVTYSLMQRIYGRFEGRDQNIYGIEETSPEPQDLGILNSRTPIDETFDLGGQSFQDTYARTRRGIRPELFNFLVAQTYDINADRNRLKLERETGQDIDPYSDLSFQSNILPNEYFRILGAMTIGPDDQNFSSYTVGAQLLDKRGDQLRTSLRYIDSTPTPVRQSESSLELRLTDRFKLGLYGRYDAVDDSWLETKIGVRFNSSCRCWILDVDYWERANPDDTRVTVTLTLNGILELPVKAWNQRNNNGDGS